MVNVIDEGVIMVTSELKDNMDFNYVLKGLSALLSACFHNHVQMRDIESYYKRNWNQGKASMTKYFPRDMWERGSKELGKYKHESFEEFVNELWEHMKEKSKEISKNNKLSDKQRSLYKSLLNRLTANEQNLHNRKVKLDNEIGYLKDPTLNEWHLPSGKEEVPNQQAAIKELKFILQKEGISTDLEKNPHLAIPGEKLAKLSKDRQKRYKDLKKQIGEAYKVALRNHIRSTGNSTVPVADAAAALKNAKIDIHSIPHELIKNHGKEIYINDAGRLHTKYGEQINNLPHVKSKITMNKDYKKGGSMAVFSYLPPKTGPKEPVVNHAYTILTTAPDGHRENKKRKRTSTMTQETMDASRKKWLKDMVGSNRKNAALGTILELLFTHQMRIGSSDKAQTDGKKTYGLLTLQVKNVRNSKDGLNLIYVGKSGMSQRHFIPSDSKTNKLVIARLLSLTKGKKPNDLLFEVKGKRISYPAVKDYIKSKGLRINPKDFRTWIADKLANEHLENNPIKKKPSQQEANDYYKDLALKVGQKLGHKSTDKKTGKEKDVANTALKSYINPKIGHEFFKKHNLIIPSFLPK